MSDLTELLDVTAEQALMFFYEHLQEEVIAKVTQDETLYVASILSHYARTSRDEREWMPAPGSLHDVFNNFILTPEGFVELQDPDILEVAGSQTLLLAGFLRDQINRTRHNPRWYDGLGSSFFRRASDRLQYGKKADLLGQVSEHFPLWTESCCKMSRTLRVKRYLLKV